MLGAVPMRHYGRMEEIPGAVAFPLGDDAGYTTGVNVPVAGGIL